MAQKLVNYIEMDEFRKLMKAEKDRKFKLAYALAMGSGLRISEIIGYKGKSRKKNKKTGEIIEKDIVIPPLTKDKVDLDRHQIRVVGKRGKERITVTSPMLNKTNIELLPLKIPRRTLQARFTRLCKKVLGKNLSFHSLRHGFANYMVNEKNVPLPMVQQMLGHSRLDTTGIYTKANPKKAIETAWESF
ncbi:MAG: tyrosine-type recombinase/integrase [Atribacterota bacterium]